VITAEETGTKTRERDVISTVLEKNGEIMLGYSGRTALRRAQCNVYDEALPGNNPTSGATVSRQRLGEHVATIAAATFSVRSAPNNSTTEFSVLSAPRQYNATLGIFATS
jgi:hypothetical protein